MNLTKQIISKAEMAINALYNHRVETGKLLINETKKEFDGDFTIVTFPLVRDLKKSPEDIGEAIGNYMVDEFDEFKSFNVIKGFLNLSLSDGFWKFVLEETTKDEHKFRFKPNGKKALVEFSSPNTNKPLHLGHLRNIFLGWSMSNILEAYGYEVGKTQIINDRGIAICKSMYAWKEFGNNETPQSTQTKGDFFVGKYYVIFNEKLELEYNTWKASEEADRLFKASGEAGKESFFKEFKNRYFNEFSKIGKSTRGMLLDWESGDPDTMALWKKMNSWVYSGFNESYKTMRVHFDSIYYESNTYLLGKEVVSKGLDRNVFYKQDDGSVWIDLEAEKLDKKILLRSDGTSVYVTQDIGTAHQRYKDHQMDHMVYVVGDEQEYHFKVLFAILKRLGESYSKNLHHLSYGMVELPSGKMKSREGTVVDADVLIREVITEAKQSSIERGELTDLSEDDREEIHRIIGLGALKYYILRINPRKWMTFDPAESLDLQGQTAPYIQNAFVRIQSVLRKFEGESFGNFDAYISLNDSEKEILRHISLYKSHLEEAALTNDPSQIANYAFSLAKMFHRFYHDCSILRAESESAKAFRLYLSDLVATTLQECMNLLGIQMPKYM